MKKKQIATKKKNNEIKKTKKTVKKAKKKEDKRTNAKSIRALRAAKILSENKGKSVSQAMVEAGYTPGYAHNPQLFKKTKAWQDLMNELLPDELLAKVHNEGLKANVIKIATHEGTITDEKEFADYPTRGKFLELAYRLKGRMAPDQIEITRGKYQGLSNAELAALEKKLIDKLKNRK